MSSRDFASSSITPMSVEPGKDGSVMTFRMRKSFEDFQKLPNPRASYRIPGIFASKKLNLMTKIQ